jgi:hypothetical protein
MPLEKKSNSDAIDIEIDTSQYYDAKGKQGITDSALLKEYILNIQDDVAGIFETI